MVEKRLLLAGELEIELPFHCQFDIGAGRKVLVCLFGFVCFLFLVSSGIILASGFLVFAEFAKNELPVVQQKVHMCIVYFNLNAAEF